MAYKRLVAYNAATTAAACSAIGTIMAQMGWMLYDDQSSASPKYYIFSSTGESSDQMTCYFMLRWGDTANKIIPRIYLNWNASTHTGTTQIGADSSLYINSYDASSFYIWVYGDKNHVSIITKCGSTYQGFSVGKPTVVFWTAARATLQGNVTSGSSKTITVSSGGTVNFVAGEQYQIVGAGVEGRDPVTVSSIDSAAGTMVIASLARNYNTGTVIGQTPYPWFLNNLHSQYLFMLGIAGTGTTQEQTNMTKREFADLTFIDPDARGRGYVIVPWILLEASAQSMVGVIDDYSLRCYAGAGNEDTLHVGQHDSGTSSGGNGTTSLNDTTKNWTGNAYANHAVVIKTGTGVGQIRAITANDSASLTIDSAWTVTPDATSTYGIADSAWRYFSWGSSSYSVACREV